MGYLIRTRLAAAMLAGTTQLSEELDLDEVMHELSSLVQTAGLDEAAFHRALVRHVARNTKRIADARVSSGDQKPKRRMRPSPLMKFLDSAHAETETELGAIPGGSDKATNYLKALVNHRTIQYTDQIYDAMVYLGESVRSLTSSVVAQWRAEQEVHRESGRAELNEHLFWVSLDFHELFDALSRYRFVEAFDIGGFEAAMEQTEGIVATPILERCSDAFEPGYKEWRSTDTFGVAFDLWMLSRSDRLIARLQAVVNLAVEWLTNMQHPTGFWVRPVEPVPLSGSRFQSDLTATALATASLLKLATTDRASLAAQRGASWLAGQQRKDGTWKGTGTELLFPTTTALEALIRTGRPELRPVVELGFAGLFALQQPIGTWEDGRLPFPMQTVLVLDVVEIRSFLNVKFEQFAVAAIAFLRAASRLRFIHGPGNRQLAVIAGAQGAEYLLYALLEEIGRDPFRSGAATETKGLKAALTEFEEHLRSTGALAPGKMAVNASALRQLSNLRDQVVHKAADVSVEEVALVDKAMTFVSHYSKMVLGRDALG